MQTDSIDKMFMVTNLEGKNKQTNKQKRRGIEIQFLTPVSLPAADLLPGCLR